MTNSLYVLSDGQKRCFQPRGRPGIALFVKNNGGLLRFSTKGEAIGRISGNGMGAKVTTEVGTARDTYHVDVLNDGEIWLTTPEYHGIHAVRVVLFDGMFDIIGGSAVIDRICGERLDARVETDSGHVA